MSAIPVLLQQVLGLTSDEDYALLRRDPRFLYHEWHLIEPCYEAVKKMLVYQSNE